MTTGPVVDARHQRTAGREHSPYTASPATSAAIEILFNNMVNSASGWRQSKGPFFWR